MSDSTAVLYLQSCPLSSPSVLSSAFHLFYMMMTAFSSRSSIFKSTLPSSQTTPLDNALALMSCLRTSMSCFLLAEARTSAKKSFKNMSPSIWFSSVLRRYAKKLLCFSSASDSCRASNTFGVLLSLALHSAASSRRLRSFYASSFSFLLVLIAHFLLPE